MNATGAPPTVIQRNAVRLDDSANWIRQLGRMGPEAFKCRSGRWYCRWTIKGARVLENWKIRANFPVNVSGPGVAP